VNRCTVSYAINLDRIVKPSCNITVSVLELV
jgi:hypothetical protein